MSRPALMRLLRLLMPLTMLALLWLWLDGPAILGRLLNSDPLWLAAAMAAGLLQIPLLAVRWRLTAGRLGQHLGLATAMREYFVAQLVNQTLPGGMLGDAARVVRTRGPAGLATAGKAVVIERLAGQFALLIVTLLGFLSFQILPGGNGVHWPPGTDSRALVWTLGILAALCGIVALAARIRPDIGRRLAAPVHRSVLARGVWPRQMALGLAVVACNLSTFAFSARAIGVTLPLEAVVTLVPLVLTAMLVPLSVAGWGFREAAAAALLPMAGIAPEAAVAASILFGAVNLAASLPGILWLAPSEDLATPR